MLQHQAGAFPILAWTVSMDRLKKALRRDWTRSSQAPLCLSSL